MPDFEETGTPFLTSLGRALSALAGLFVLFLLGVDFAGEDEDEDQGDRTGFGKPDGVNMLNGEQDGGLDPEGIYW